MFQRYHGSFTEFWARREPFLARGKGKVLTRSRQVGKARREGQVPSAEKKRVAEVERRITEHETEKRQVETDITAAFSRGNHQEGRRLANRLAQVSRMLKELYEEWETMAE